MKQRKQLDGIQVGWFADSAVNHLSTRIGFTERGWMTTIGIGPFVISFYWHFEERL